MGVKERKERDKLERREQILQAAHDLFLEKGFEQVSIRNIAEAIEYSPATIYLYFKDKNEIFHALHTQAFGKFNEYQQSLPQITDPLDRLMFMGKAYMQFSLKHPEYYDIMFIMQAPMDLADDLDCAAVWPEGKCAHDLLENLILECINQGHFKGHDYKSLALMVWASVHGLCSLKIRDRLRIYPEEIREEMFNNAYETFKKLLLCV